MLFATRYQYVGPRSPEEIKAMLTKFAELGEAPGTVSHYVAADGRGGLVITDNDTLRTIHQFALHYRPWFDFEITPLLTIEEAMQDNELIFG
jgi:hypothetical protein